MASDTGKLTVLKIKAAKVGKHFDGGGLFLHVTESGRYWRMKYRHAGKEKLLALGVYPEVGLSEARQRRDEARALLRDCNDPARSSETGKQPMQRPRQTPLQRSPTNSASTGNR